MILLLSPGGTGGWRANEDSLAAALARLGVEHEVRRVDLRGARRLLRPWALGAPLVGWLSRRELGNALGRSEPDAVIAVNASSALLLPFADLRKREIPVAIRADSPASEIWDGPSHLPHRRLEHRALGEADLVLSMGPRSTKALRPFARAVAEVPFGIEPRGEPARPGSPPRVVAYGGEPRQKGLDLICAAWAKLGDRRGDAVLTITGIDPERGQVFLSQKGVREPAAVEWAGGMPRESFLTMLEAAAVFVSASRWEDHGLAQLEALAAGVPLVTTSSKGPYEAEPLAHRLDPELVVVEDPDGIAAGIDTALGFSDERRREYARLAAELLEPFSASEVDRRLAGALNSLGLNLPAAAAPAPTGARTPPQSAD